MTCLLSNIPGTFEELNSEPHIAQHMLLSILGVSYLLLTV
jgi:hypothetical protein